MRIHAQEFIGLQADTVINAYAPCGRIEASDSNRQFKLRQRSSSSAESVVNNKSSQEAHTLASSLPIATLSIR